jgi:hypothetical protein
VKPVKTTFRTIFARDTVCPLTGKLMGKRYDDSYGSLRPGTATTMDDYRGRAAVLSGCLDRVPVSVSRELPNASHRLEQGQGGLCAPKSFALVAGTGGHNVNQFPREGPCPQKEKRSRGQQSIYGTMHRK